MLGIDAPCMGAVIPRVPSMTISRLIPRVGAASALLVLAAAGAHAAPGASRANGTTLKVGVGLDYTDNAYGIEEANRVCQPSVAVPDPVCVRSELKEFTDIEIGYERQGSALEASIRYDGELANYEHDTTEVNHVVQGESKLAWNVLPKRLALEVSHERTEQLQNSRDPNVRSNRQLRDVYTLGPRLTARLSPVDDLLFGLHYTGVSYDDFGQNELQQNASDGGTDAPGSGSSANSDSERVEASAGWQHRLSPTDVMSLMYQRIEAEFESDIEDIRYDRLFASYNVQLASSIYTIALGANKVQRDIAGDNDGFYGQATWKLDYAGHRLSIDAVNELTDSSIGLGGNGTVDGDFRPEDSNFDVVDTLERTTLKFGYGYDRICERCILDLRLSFDEQDFDVQPRDQQTTDYGATFRYRLTPMLTAVLSATRSEREFTSDDRQDDLAVYRLSVKWRLSRAINAEFWYSDTQRDSNVVGQDYEEKAAGARIDYRFR